MIKQLLTLMGFMTSFCLATRAQYADMPIPTGSKDTIREISVTMASGMRHDTVPHRIDWQFATTYKQPFPVQSFILPAALIGYGVTAVHNNSLQKVNAHMKEEIWEDIPHRKVTYDNYLMFAPTVMLYGLNAAGIHGQHNFKDRTMIVLMANLFANGTVFTVKGRAGEKRPDGSDDLSFPSGHTAEAFVGAELVRLEYKDVSPWYGVGAYAMATATGMLRMYNNKHWLSDVMAGAGVGIASARLAYWLYPKVQRLFSKDKDPGRTAASVLMPTYQNGSLGLAYVHHF